MNKAISISILYISLFVTVAKANTQIWFSPNKSDFLSDRAQDEGWKKARSNINVYKFYYQGIMGTPLPELKEKFRFLRENNISIAVEWPAMTWQENGTGYEIEGFSAPGFSKKIVDKIKSAGGTLEYVAMDEVIFFGHQKKVNQFSPNYPISQVANEINNNLQYIWQVFPNAKVGDIEPLEQYGKDYLTEMNTWLSEYKKTTGRPLDFLHADVVWEENWRQTLPSVMETARKEGVRFGVIFNATKSTGPDNFWMISARKNIDSYMNAGIEIPDDVIFQSWNKHPESISYDGNQHSHASLIPYFLEERKIYKYER